MSDNISLTSNVKLKTNRIHNNSMCLMRDRKVTKVFVAHEKGVHVYDCYQKQFEEVKIGDTTGGVVVSCLTNSTLHPRQATT